MMIVPDWVQRVLTSSYGSDCTYSALCCVPQWVAKSVTGPCRGTTPREGGADCAGCHAIPTDTTDAAGEHAASSGRRHIRCLAQLATAVRNEIHAVDPQLAVFDEKTIEEHVKDALILPRANWPRSGWSANRREPEGRSIHGKITSVWSSTAQNSEVRKYLGQSAR